MTTMTLSVPNDLKSSMDLFPEINWSEVARQAFIQKVDDMSFLRKIKSDSTMTKEDALEMGRKLNKNLAKRYSK